MSTLNFINSSALRGDASLISNSKLLLQSSGNTTATQSFIFNDGAASKLALGIGDPATASNIKFFIDSAGDINISSNVGIGTAPQTNDDLAVKGNIHAISGLRDGSSSLGSNNYVLTSTGSATAWADASSSSIIGGPYLPLTAGSSKPLSGDLYLTLSATDQRALSSTGIDSIQIGDAGVNELKFKNTFGTVAVMNASGRVGIGTTSPGTQVDIQSAVANSLRVKSDDSASIIIDSDGDNSGTAGSYLHYRDTGGTKWTLYKETNNDFYLYNAAATTYPIHAKAGGDIVVMEDGNNFGIGASTPTQKLDVRGNTLIAADTPANPIGVTGLEVYNNEGQARLMIHQDDGNSTSVLSFRTGGNDTNVYQPASNSALKIDTETGINAFDLKITGSLQLTQYGSGTFTGTTANLLAVDSSGNIIETSTSGESIVTGSGTAEYIPKWNSTTALVNSKMFQSTASSQTTLNVGSSSGRMALKVVPETTSNISNYDFSLELNNDSTFNVGGQSKVYSTIWEGIKILPATSHYLTRITPRLEVYPFEDPSTTTDNTYDSSFTGSSFSMGSSNTIGDSDSSNLAIFGFNNELKGDKMVVIGQGNTVKDTGTANTSSLVIGTTNTINQGTSPTPPFTIDGDLKNSLLVGQNNTIQRSVVRSIVSGINNSITGNTNNTLAAGSGNQIFGNNNFIWGASNQGSAANNAMIGGFSNQFVQTSGNTYGTVLVGWNNTNQTNCKASIITGRDNVVDRCDYSIVGGFNNDVGQGGTAYENTLVVGNNNQVNGNDHIVGGDNNTVSQNRSIVSGTSNTVSASNCLVVGTSNDVRIEESIVGGNNNNIGDNSDTNDDRILVMGQNNSTSNTSNTLLIGSGNTTGNNTGAPTNVTNAATFGQNNTLATAGNAPDNNFLLFSMGRSNNTSGTLAFAFGGGNTVRSNTNGNCIAIGNANTIGWTTTAQAARNTIVIGTQNNISNTVHTGANDYKILIGRGLDDVKTAGDDYVLIGRNNDENNDYSILNLSCSLIVGASTMGGSSDRRNAIVVTNKTSSSDESNVILPSVGKYRNYANDSAAATGGVPLYGIYHTNGALKIRVT